jgi:hypothetical protein
MIEVAFREKTIKNHKLSGDLDKSDHAPTAISGKTEIASRGDVSVHILDSL